MIYFAKKINLFTLAVSDTKTISVKYYNHCVSVSVYLSCLQGFDAVGWANLGCRKGIGWRCGVVVSGVRQ